MKIIWKIIVAVALTMNSASAENITLADYQQDIAKLTALYEKLGVGQVVESVQNDFTKIIDEVVTERESDGGSNSAAGFAVTGYSVSESGAVSVSGIPFLINTTSSSSWDVTKMIVRNPQEAANFPAKAAADLRELRQRLKHYIRDNQTDIIALKAYAANALHKASELIKQGVPFSANDIQIITDMALRLDFAGQQTVTSCVQTNYAARSRVETSQTSVSFLGFSFPIGSSEKIWTQAAHSTKSCESEINTISMSPEQTIYKVNFTQIDHNLKSWANTAFGQTLFTTNNPGHHYPTFGSPYFFQ